MDNMERDIAVEYGKKYIRDKWMLNVYLIKSNPNEAVSSDVVTKIIEKHLLLIESGNMSEEFDYYRTGFAFLHFGNRGIDLTIWHIGRWGNTFETFVCSWYCYNREIDNMEQLDAAEPMLCQYEMKLFAKEILNISQLVQYKSIDDIRDRYVAISINKQ